ncbi:MAG: hypothetical protein NTZ50_01940 [Chloroflexi bacterium]|nr:hypothetical protein [Chloroflexota bacterium]
MSEFQYYEWLALDRPLTSAQLAEVKELSSHMDRVTRTSACVSYSYGDFKHDPLDVLARNFDVFFYHSNWGTKTLAFRFSSNTFLSNTFTSKDIDPYLIEGCVKLDRRGDFWILSFTLENDGDDAWIDPENETDSAASIAGVRRQITQGDYRALYLMWIAKVGQYRQSYSKHDDFDIFDIEEDIGEAPPLPAGLQDLDAALNEFCNFFAIDKNMIAVAAQQSAQVKDPSQAEIRAAIASLPRNECEDFLLRLLDDGTPLSDELRQRLALASDSPQTTSKSVAQLMQDAHELEANARHEAKAHAHAVRIAAFEDLAKREARVWQAIDELVAQKKSSSYDEAARMLSELHELAMHRSTLTVFKFRVNELIERSGKSRALINRLKKKSIEF